MYRQIFGVKFRNANNTNYLICNFIEQFIGIDRRKKKKTYIYTIHGSRVIQRKRFINLKNQMKVFFENDVMMIKVIC